MEGGIALLLLVILAVIGGIAIAILGTSTWLARHRRAGAAGAAEHPRRMRVRRDAGGTHVTSDTGSARDVPDDEP